jgi:hypothetical protein
VTQADEEARIDALETRVRTAWNENNRSRKSRLTFGSLSR